MICKWCGASLPGAQGKCRRCGKEQPPLSECGGFYNIARTPAPGAPAGAPAPAPKRAGLNPVLAVACLVLAALLLWQLATAAGLRADLKKQDRDTPQREDLTLTLTRTESGLEVEAPGEMKVDYAADGTGITLTLEGEAVEKLDGWELVQAAPNGAGFADSTSGLGLFGGKDDGDGKAEEDAKDGEDDKDGEGKDPAASTEDAPVLPGEDEAKPDDAEGEAQPGETAPELTVRAGRGKVTLQLSRQDLEGLGLTPGSGFALTLRGENSKGGSLTVVIFDRFPE